MTGDYNSYGYWCKQLYPIPPPYQHAHSFQRLNDLAIFCACGEIRYSKQSVACVGPDKDAV